MSMLDRDGRLNHTFLLFVFSVLSILALYVRNYIIGNSQYNFLLWNLFLGFVPLATAWFLGKFAESWHTLAYLVGAGLWLLFYPNAPYMISDFIHVKQAQSYVLYDALLIFNLAILSTFYGLYSMSMIYAQVTRRFSKFWANFGLVASVVLAAFGVYLGRVLRLNSWDLFTHPIKTVEMIFSHLFPISANPQTWALIVIFSFLQFLLLFLVYGVNDKD